MEEVKIDKRGKEYKNSLKALSSMPIQQDQSLGNHPADGCSMALADSYRADPKNTLTKLIEAGIPVSKAAFHSAVNNADDVPENEFNEKSEKANRRAEMWLVAGGSFLVCKQKGKHFFVPSASVKFGVFKS